MHLFERYLQKHSFSEPLISELPDSDLYLSIVIPCYNEPDVLKSLESLYNCYDTLYSSEIIIVINHAKNAEIDIKALNINTIDKIKEWAVSKNSRKRRFFVIRAFDIPDRDAGVGLARKTGMDEAIRRFRLCGNKNGVILGFDSDCTCSKNYLKEIENCFLHKKVNAVSVYFEHPLAGNDFDSQLYKSIEQYELHLRYYKNAVKWTGFPFAFHTVGSSFAVRADVYCKQGGMNKRKAGEDFYFLSKVIPLGKYEEVNTVVVYPSPRQSDRVPFGTGAAIKEMIEKNQDKFYTYPFELFVMLKDLFTKTDEMYSNISFAFPQNILGEYCRIESAVINIGEIRNNTASVESFTKRFYSVFNAFRILKFLNYAVANGFSMSDSESESIKLLKETKVDINGKKTIELLREIDRKF